METYISNVILDGICEIDESMLTAKRLGPNGRIPRGIFWAFGILQRNLNRVVIYMVSKQAKRDDITNP